MTTSALARPRDVSVRAYTPGGIETPLMKFSQLTNRVRRWMQNRGVVS